MLNYNQFNHLFNSTFDNASDTNKEVEQMDNWNPKYFSVAIRITGHTQHVDPAKKKTGLFLTNSAAATALWLELTRNGYPIEIESIKLGSKTIVRYVLPGVEGYQFRPQNEIEGLTGESENASLMLIREKLDANVEINEAGRQVFTVIEDMILHIDPEVYKISKGVIKHSKRIKAPAYNIAPDYAPGLPAAFTENVRIVDVEDKCKDELLLQEVPCTGIPTQHRTALHTQSNGYQRQPYHSR